MIIDRDPACGLVLVPRPDMGRWSAEGAAIVPQEDISMAAECIGESLQAGGRRLKSSKMSQSEAERAQLPGPHDSWRKSYHGQLRG